MLDPPIHEEDGLDPSQWKWVSVEALDIAVGSAFRKGWKEMQKQYPQVIRLSREAGLL